MTKKLDLRNKLDRSKFVAKTIEKNLDPKAAMKELAPHMTPRSLDNKLVAWLANPDIISELVEEVKRLKLTSENKKLLVEGRMLKILTNNDAKDSDAIAAGSLMLKANGMLSDSGNVNVNILNASGDKLDNIITNRLKAQDMVVIEDDTQGIV